MAQQLIHFTKAAATVRARRERDDAVRSAQQAAFEEVLRSRGAAARRRAVRAAVDAFLDACESSKYASV